MARGGQSRKGLIDTLLSPAGFRERRSPRLAPTSADLEIGPDGRLYLLSDKSSTITLIDDLPAGGGTADLVKAWRIGELDGKPEGLAFTAQGCAVVGLDTRKRRSNLVLLEPAIARAPVAGASSLGENTR